MAKSYTNGGDSARRSGNGAAREIPLHKQPYNVHLNTLVNSIGEGHGFQKHVLDQDISKPIKPKIVDLKQNDSEHKTHQGKLSVNVTDLEKKIYKDKIKDTLDSEKTYTFTRGDISYFYNKRHDLKVIANPRDSKGDNGTAYRPEPMKKGKYPKGESKETFGFTSFQNNYVTSKNDSKEGREYRENNNKKNMLQASDMEGAKWPVGGLTAMRAARSNVYGEINREYKPGYSAVKDAGSDAGGRNVRTRAVSPLLRNATLPPETSGHSNKKFSTNITFKHDDSQQIKIQGNYSITGTGKTLVGKFQNVDRTNVRDQTQYKAPRENDSRNDGSLQVGRKPRRSGNDSNAKPARSSEPDNRTSADGKGPSKVISGSSGLTAPTGNEKSNQRSQATVNPNRSKDAYSNQARYQSKGQNLPEQSGYGLSGQYGNFSSASARAVSFSSSEAPRNVRRSEKPLGEMNERANQSGNSSEFSRKQATPDYSNGHAGQSAHGQGGRSNPPRGQESGRQGERDRSGYRGR